MEEGGGGVDDGDVDRAVAAFVGEDEGDAEDVADESGDAVGGSEEQFSGLRGDQIGRRSGGGEAVVEHGVEERGVGLGGELGVGDDALGEGGVLLQTSHGDRVLEVNGTKIYTFAELKDVIQKNPGRELQFIVFRNRERVEVTITPSERRVEKPLDIVDTVGEIGIGPHEPAAVIGHSVGEYAAACAARLGTAPPGALAPKPGRSRATTSAPAGGAVK